MHDRRPPRLHSRVLHASANWLSTMLEPASPTSRPIRGCAKGISQDWPIVERLQIKRNLPKHPVIRIPARGLEQRLPTCLHGAQSSPCRRKARAVLPVTEPPVGRQCVGNVAWRNASFRLRAQHGSSPAMPTPATATEGRHAGIIQPDSVAHVMRLSADASGTRGFMTPPPRRISSPPNTPRIACA